MEQHLPRPHPSTSRHRPTIWWIRHLPRARLHRSHCRIHIACRIFAPLRPHRRQRHLHRLRQMDFPSRPGRVRHRARGRRMVVPEMRMWNRTWTRFRAFRCHRSSLCILRETLRWPLLGASGDWVCALFLVVLKREIKVIQTWLYLCERISLSEKHQPNHLSCIAAHRHHTSYDCTQVTILRLSFSPPSPSGLEFKQHLSWN